MIENDYIKKMKWLMGCLIFLLVACSSALQGPADEILPVETDIITSTSVTVSTALPTLTLTASLTPTQTSTPIQESSFSFVVTSDMSYTGGKEYINYPNFFAALLGYVKQFDPGVFMISPGDVLPVDQTRWTIDQVLGENYLWFPIPGNHDFGTEDFNYLENYDYDPNGTAEPNIVNWGPESCPHTTYSFDYQNTHFIALNVYCDEKAPWGIDGSITDVIYDWLAMDLENTDKEHIFVFGHEPAFPQPDAQTGYTNHQYESLDQYPEARDRFWELLISHNVVAYIHGHTHGYSAQQFSGVWQLDAGHAMGVRAAPTPGTFLIITVNGDEVYLETYRGEAGPGFEFLLWEEIQLEP